MKHFIIKLLIVISLFASAYYLYPSLPEKIPTHWNYAGQVDAYGTRDSIYVAPFICLGMLLLFSILKKVDPKQMNYEKFSTTWEIIQYSLLLFFAYIFAISIYASLHPAFDVGMAVMLGIGVLFVILGNFMGKLRQNYFIGYKLPWTLNNEEVWNKTHRFAGKCMMLSGFIFMVNAWPKFYPLPIFITAMVILGVLPIVYSYSIFHTLSKN